MSEQARIEAKDLSGAMAGSIEPNPAMNTVDEVASQTGVEVEPEKPLHIYETIKARDENRLEQ